MKKSELWCGEYAVGKKQAKRGKMDGSLTFTGGIYIGSKKGGISFPLGKINE